LGQEEVIGMTSFLNFLLSLFSGGLIGW